MYVCFRRRWRQPSVKKDAGATSSSAAYGPVDLLDDGDLVIVTCAGANIAARAIGEESAADRYLPAPPEEAPLDVGIVEASHSNPPSDTSEGFNLVPRQRQNTDIWDAVEASATNFSKTRCLKDAETDVRTAAQYAAQSIALDVSADVRLQTFGRRTMDGVPLLLHTLEALARVHPFVELAFIPFQLIYHLEVKRRDNDHRRAALFGLIKDAMLALVELEYFTDDYKAHRTTPTGEKVKSRIVAVCEQMQRDINMCYAGTDAPRRSSVDGMTVCFAELKTHDKSAPPMQFVRAASWNRVLSEYGTRFKATREDLAFALQIENAVAVNKMHHMLVEQIEAKTPPPWEHPDPLRSSEIAEQDAYGHGQQNGLASQSLPTQSLSPGTADEACWMGRHYESPADIMDITTADFNDCCTRFELGSEIMALSLDGVVKGDRVVRAVQGKFRNGVRDPMVDRVWDEQEFGQSVEIWRLALALRDSLVQGDGWHTIDTDVGSDRPPGFPVPELGGHYPMYWDINPTSSGQDGYFSGYYDGQNQEIEHPVQAQRFGHWCYGRCEGSCDWQERYGPGAGCSGPATPWSDTPDEITVVGDASPLLRGRDITSHECGSTEYEHPLDTKRPRMNRGQSFGALSRVGTTQDSWDWYEYRDKYANGSRSGTETPWSEEPDEHTVVGEGSPPIRGRSLTSQEYGFIKHELACKHAMPPHDCAAGDPADLCCDMAGLRSDEYHTRDSPDSMVELWRSEMDRVCVDHPGPVLLEPTKQNSEARVPGHLAISPGFDESPDLMRIGAFWFTVLLMLGLST
ncbi:hypothetical protein GGX14DRAFT_611297 [Mycena pura]|uniref:Uncharacterized protein n=1 Tax=Mycena pura TaxID=153505 RepID=A0AAD6UP98_9AGAR|nr:hypothetical protein GGX14DRAFT_611297 [Mycena pura]